MFRKILFLSLTLVGHFSILSAASGTADVGTSGWIDMGDGVLKDGKSGLQWTSHDNGREINWKDATAYCGAKSGGWRLPTTDELAALYSEGEARGDSTRCGSFTCKVSPLFHLTDVAFWTSTRDDNGPSARDWGWIVSLRDGTHLQVKAANTFLNRALCTRLPQAAATRF